MECSENHSAFHYFNSFSWSNLESFTSFRIRKGKKLNVKPNQFKKQTFITTIFIFYFRIVCMYLCIIHVKINVLIVP